MAFDVIVVGKHGATALGAGVAAIFGGGGPPPEIPLFVDHPRLLLTSARLAELTARRIANTTEYQAMKTPLDAGLAQSWLTHETMLSAPITSTATSIPVVDGSVFPSSGAFIIRINCERINIASRSGNTLTVATSGRGALSVNGHATAAVAHASGATVWEHQDGVSFADLAPIAALMDHIGVTGYVDKARAAFSIFMHEAATFHGSTNLDQIRYWWRPVSLCYDWLYDHLSADDIAAYSEAMRWTTNYHLNTVAVPKEWNTLLNVPFRQSAVESALFNNIGNGQLCSEMMMSAAIYGDQPDALTHWTACMAKVDTYLIPAITTGVACQGVSSEGSDYPDTSWIQTFDILDVIGTATGDTSYLAYMDAVAPAAARHIFLATIPGSAIQGVGSTTGSISAGSRTLTVASAAGWSVGDAIYVTMDATPFNFATYVTAISGTTFTLCDPIPGASTNKAVLHQVRMVPWADAVQNIGNRYIDSPPDESGQHYEMMVRILDRLRTTNPTWAGYVRHWLTLYMPANIPTNADRMRFMYHDPSVAAIDYTAQLEPYFASASPTSTGLIYARSDWSRLSTQVTFLVGGERFDHTHSDANSYMLRRKGVWLSREIPFYGETPADPNYWQTLYGSPPANSNFNDLGFSVGPRYHNAILMNLHGAATGYSGNVIAGAASIAREAITDDYVYARGDASGVYKNHPTDTDTWVARGHASNAADLFLRDFLYLKPDLVVFADRVGYTASALNQTIWIAQFPAEPTVSVGTITSTYAGQTLVQTLIQPSAGTLTKVDQGPEAPLIIPNKTPGTAWRVETVSNATTNLDHSFQVIEMMDEGVTPQTLTGHTASANFTGAQIGSTYFVGAVRGTSITLPFAYTVTGAPTHYWMGLTPDTEYTVTSVSGLTTIAASSGSNVRTTNSAGLLIFPTEETGGGGTPLAYVSAASGNWNVPTNWTPNGVPGVNDTATANHAMTVNVSTTLGGLTANAAVTLAADVIFTVPGNALVGNAPFTMGAGSELVFDCTAANRRFIMGTASNQTLCNFVVNGLVGNRCTVRKIGSNHCWFEGGGAISNTTGIQASYCDFVGITDVTGTLGFVSNDFGAKHRHLLHCTFNGCGTWFGGSTTWSAAALNRDFRVENCETLNLPSGSQGIRMVSTNTPGAGTLTCIGNVFAEPPGNGYSVTIGLRGVLIQDTFFDSCPSMTGTSVNWSTGNTIRQSSRTQTFQPNTGLGPMYLLADHVDPADRENGTNNVGNPHFIQAAVPGAGVTFDGLVFEYPHALLIDGGDGIFGDASGLKASTIQNCLSIPSMTDGVMSTNIHAMKSGDNIKLLHNTCVGKRCQLTFNERDLTGQTIVSEMKSNLVAGVTQTGLPNPEFGSAAYDLVGPVIAQTDLVATAQIKNNYVFMPVPDNFTDGTGVCPNDAAGYHLRLSVAPDGTNSVDITTGPQFVDPTRNAAAWAVMKGAALVGDTKRVKLDAVRTLLKANPLLGATDLMPWVKAGFVPTNAALLNAGHDGVTIGMVP
jgi:hypothetical protein